MDDITKVFFSITFWIILFIISNASFTYYRLQNKVRNKMIYRPLMTMIFFVATLHGAEGNSVSEISIDDNGKLTKVTEAHLVSLTNAELIDLIRELKLENNKIKSANEELRVMCKVVRDVAKGLNDKLAELEDELKKYKRGEF